MATSLCSASQTSSWSTKRTALTLQMQWGRGTLCAALMESSFTRGHPRSSCEGPSPKNRAFRCSSAGQTLLLPRGCNGLSFPPPQNPCLIENLRWVMCVGVWCGVMYVVSYFLIWFSFPQEASDLATIHSDSTSDTKGIPSPISEVGSPGAFQERAL